MATTPGGISTPDLATAFVEEFAAAIAALVGFPATVTPATGTIDLPWTVGITINEPAPLSLVLGLSKEDCTELVHLVRGAESAVSDTAVTEILKELTGQTVGTLHNKPAGKGLLLLVEAPVPPADPPAGEPTCFTIVVTPEFEPTVAVWAMTGVAVGERRAESAAATSSGAAKIATAAGAGRENPSAPPAAMAGVPANLDVILDIDLPLSVRFGQTDLSLDALTRLGPGSVIDLGRSPDDLVDVLVNGRLVARAEVVVVAGNYGVRILEVVSAADRVRSLRA